MIPRIHFELGLAYKKHEGGVRKTSESQIVAPSHGDLTSIIQRIRQEALSQFDRQAFALLEEVQFCWTIAGLFVRKNIRDKDLFAHVAALNSSKDGLEAHLQGGKRLRSNEDPVTICQNALKAIRAFDRFLTRLIHEGHVDSHEIDEVVEEFRSKIEAFNSIGVFLRIESLWGFPELKAQLGYLRSMVMSCINGNNQSMESNLEILRAFGLRSSSPQAVDLFLKRIESQVREGHFSQPVNSTQGA